MEFRLLRYFIVVAEELHLARAAERLGIEQSPVSRAMRDLERLLGVQLFDRSTRQTRLTWAGKVLLGEAHQPLGWLTVHRHAQVDLHNLGASPFPCVGEPRAHGHRSCAIEARAIDSDIGQLEGGV